MLCSITSACLKGIEGYIVNVEVDIAAGLPALTLVGLPDQEVKEAKDRVLAAIRNSGFDSPVKKITINLVPAEIKKSGTHFDLPIALGILGASGQLSDKAIENLKKFVFIGSLGLTGKIHGCAGVLPMLIALSRKAKNKAVIPQDNAQEAKYASMECFKAF